jgi:hypothetical protein
VRTFLAIAGSLLFAGAILAAVGTGVAARKLRRFSRSGRRASRELKLTRTPRNLSFPMPTKSVGSCGGPSCAVS